MMKRLILTGFGMLAALGANATLKTWDVDDYVQDGLIVHYDAIRNVGANLPHDSTATSWADISPSGLGGAATEMLAVSGKERGTWTDNAYSTSGWTYMQMANTITLGLEYTIQIACDLDKGYWKEELGGNNYPCPFANGEFGIYLDRSYDGARGKTNLYWKTDAYSNNGASGNRPSCVWTKGNYVNLAMTPSNMFLTGAAQWPNAVTRNVKDVPVPALTYTFGGRSGRSGGNCTLGDYHSVRIYSRKLTDSELEWNRMVDEIRFHDTYTFPVTNVFVAADVLGGNGAEGPGFHMVVGSHVFTAGNVTIGGATYQPVGYALATWDASSGFWGEPVTYEGTSYTYVASESSPAVRLAWIWRLASGIARLDVGNYVQDGLIAHYDGVHNMGAGQLHSNVATTWADLVRGDAGIFKKTVSGTSYGNWTDTGFYFDGYSYFETEKKLTLGGAFTVQLVVDTERGVIDSDHPYPNVWGSGEFSVYLDRSYAAAIAATNLTWKTDQYNGGSSSTRARFPWDGKYANAAFDDQYVYLVQTPYWDDGNTYSRRVHTVSSPTVPALKYSWGGRYGSSNSANRCSRGYVYAWRAYSRKLTDSELAWNRDVDEVRFRNALPTTMSNAVVVVSAHDSFMAAEDGVYALGGSYTFTASQQRLGNSIYTPKYAVETWNNATKEWVRTAEAESDRCVLNEADGTAPRRIVWQWRKEGFSLILR